MAFQSHLLWLTDLLMAQTKKLEQSNSRAAIQPVQLKWVQALLTDFLTILATNSILVRHDLAISSIDSAINSIAGELPKIHSGDWDFYLCLETWCSISLQRKWKVWKSEEMKAKCSRCLKQAAQLKPILPRSEPQGSFRGSALTSQPKFKSRSSDTPFLWANPTTTTNLSSIQWTTVTTSPWVQEQNQAKGLLQPKKKVTTFGHKT